LNENEGAAEIEVPLNLVGQTVHEFREGKDDARSDFLIDFPIGFARLINETERRIGGNRLIERILELIENGRIVTDGEHLDVAFAKVVQLPFHFVKRAVGRKAILLDRDDENDDETG